MDSTEPTLIRDPMKYWLLQPDARLRRHIRCYFVVDAGQSAYGRHELLLPDGYAELVFMLDASFERWRVSDETRRAVMNRSYLIGGRSHSVLTGGSNKLKLIGVKLDPRALRRLIAAPLVEFRDATLDLRDLNNKPLLILEDSVARARSIREISNTLDRFFLRQLAACTQQDPMVEHFVRRIHAERGAGAIAPWARELEVDARTLERKFSAWIGMAPKTYARIVRFKHSYHRLITQSPQSRPAVLQYLEGYYDQSHFNKDFKYFTGVAPSALRAERTPSSTVVTDHLLRGDLSAASVNRLERAAGVCDG
jgi:AraC-like DNA-binding protein